MSLRNRLEPRSRARVSDRPVSPSWTARITPPPSPVSDRVGTFFVLETEGEPPAEQIVSEACEQARQLAESAEALLRTPGYCPSCGVVHSAACVQTSLFPGLGKKLRAVLETLGTPLEPKLMASAKGSERSGDKVASPLLLLAEAIRLHPCREYHARLVSVLDLRLDLHGNDASLNDALSLILESWVRAHPDDVDALLRMARFSRQRGATRRALEFATRAAQRCPDRQEIKVLKLEMLLGSALRRMRQRRAHLMLLDIEAMSELTGLGTLLMPLQMALRALAWELSPSGQSRSDSLAMVAVHTGDPVSAFLLVHDLVELGAHPGFRMTLKIDPNPATAIHLLATGLARFTHWRQILDLPGGGIVEVLRRVAKRLPLVPIPIREADLEVICRAAQAHGRTELLLRLTRDALVLGPSMPSAAVLLWRARALELSGESGRRVEECLEAAYARAVQEQDLERIRIVQERLSRRDSTQAGEGPEGSDAIRLLPEAAMEQVLLRERALGSVSGIAPEPGSMTGRRARRSRALSPSQSEDESGTERVSSSDLEHEHTRVTTLH